MKSLIKQLDQNLSRLAWSLWTELGVAGLEHKHQNYSVSPEELILLTSALSEFDPRLRDEALDWSIQNHRFISPLRLQILGKKYEAYIRKPLSIFSSTVNAFANIRTKWTIMMNASPLKLRPSGKSQLRSFEDPSMIHFRLRSFFGVGAKADVIAYLLTERREDFAISDLIELGFSKKRLAEILADLAGAGILSESRVRNQFRYNFVRRDQFIKLIGEIPKKMVHWDRILSILLPIRACIKEVEGTPVGVRVIDMRNLFNDLTIQLLQLKLTPPPLQQDFEDYWNNVAKRIIDFSESLSKGKFKG